MIAWRSNICFELIFSYFKFIFLLFYMMLCYLFIVCAPKTRSNTSVLGYPHLPAINKSVLIGRNGLVVERRRIVSK